MEVRGAAGGDANFAWVQHFIHHLSPTGTAGFVLANGSMASNRSSEGEKEVLEGVHGRRRIYGRAAAGT